MYMRSWDEYHNRRTIHRHNINPVSFTHWREIFFECGKAELKNRTVVMTLKHDRKMDKLKRIIEEITIINYALKKTLEESTK